MHDHVCFIAPIAYCVILSLMYETFCKKLLSFYTEMVSAYFLWRSMLLRGKLRKYAKNSNFENFESALYLKSGKYAFKMFADTVTVNRNVINIFFFVISLAELCFIKHQYNKY